MNLSRREAAWLVVRAAALTSGAAFFEEWLAAQPAHSHPTPPPAPDRWTNYRPQFFSPAEMHILDAFTSILIPTDDTPGAREAHVVPFIDFVVYSAAEFAPEEQTQWRSALAWLTSQNFAQLNPHQQTALIEEISQPANANFPTFHLIKEMTLHAFYTSRVGLIDVLEYQGNMYLTEFPACTHPEHRQV